MMLVDFFPGSLMKSDKFLGNPSGAIRQSNPKGKGPFWDSIFQHISDGLGPQTDACLRGFRILRDKYVKQWFQSYFIGDWKRYLHHKMPISWRFPNITIHWKGDYFLLSQKPWGPRSELTQQWILDQFKMYFLPKKGQLSIGPMLVYRRVVGIFSWSFPTVDGRNPAPPGMYKTL